MSVGLLGVVVAVMAIIASSINSSIDANTTTMNARMDSLERSLSARMDRMESKLDLLLASQGVTLPAKHK